MKILLGVLNLVFILIIACSNSKNPPSNNTPVTETKKTENSSSKKEDWMKEDKTKWPQILLTNTYIFKGRDMAFGASSFLVISKTDTFMCTAKHLLGAAMGVSPEVKTSEVNKLLKEWVVYTRSNTICSDSLNTKDLVTIEENDKDILLFSIKDRKHSIQPLKPNFNTLLEGEELYIIGCEYSDRDCHQKVYEAKVYTYDEGKMFIQSKTKFAVSGFSGAPVIDKNGFVVGVVSGGGQHAGNLYLSLEPITSVKKWLE